jgi:hypothetical protein
MCPGGLDASGLGELAQAAGSGVPVHRGAAAVERDWPACAGSGCPVDGPPDRWRQRDQDDLGALAAHPQDPVAVLFAEIGDVRGGRLEDHLMPARIEIVITVVIGEPHAIPGASGARLSVTPADHAHRWHLTAHGSEHARP